MTLSLLFSDTTVTIAITSVNQRLAVSSIIKLARQTINTQLIIQNMACTN